MERFVFDSVINLLEMLTSCFFAAGIFRRELRGRKNILSFFLAGVCGAVFLTAREYVFPGVPDFLPAVLTFALYAMIGCRAKPWMAVPWSFVNYLFIGINVILARSAVRLFLPSVTESEEIVRGLSYILARVGQLSLSEIILLVWKRFPISTAAGRRNWRVAVMAVLSSILIWIFCIKGFEINGNVLYSNSLLCLLVLALNILFLLFDEVLAKEKHMEAELRTQSRLNALQVKSQEEVNRMYQSILSLKHDMFNHLHTVSGYIQVGEYEKAGEYVGKIAGEVSALKSFHSGNTVVDALIGSKTTLAEMNDIPVEVDLDVPQELLISDEHLTVMIGNLYDNAIEANLKIADPERRFIYIRIVFDEKNLLFLFENAVSEDVWQSGGGEWTTTKEDRIRHGFGIRNIDEIVERYGGYCEREQKDSVFYCRIRIPGK